MKVYFMTLIFSLLAFSGGTIMAEPSELVLQSTIEPDRVLKTIDLYSEENSLGSGGLQRIMEGKVTVGKRTFSINRGKPENWARDLHIFQWFRNRDRPSYPGLLRRYRETYDQVYSTEATRTWTG